MLRVCQNREQIDEKEVDKHIIESEVMRSLFDIEMCVPCKYQRILYRDFIKKLEHMDMIEIKDIDSKLNCIIKEVVDSYMNKSLKLNENQEI